MFLSSVVVKNKMRYRYKNTTVYIVDDGLFYQLFIYGVKKSYDKKEFTFDMVAQLAEDTIDLQQ